MTDAVINRARVARRLWELSEKCSDIPEGDEHPFARYKHAKVAFSRMRNKYLGLAPTRDPEDPTRKLNSDDREAWVMSQPEVMKAEDEYVVAEIAYTHYQERVWARKDEAEYLRTLSADARADMALL